MKSNVLNLLIAAIGLLATLLSWRHKPDPSTIDLVFAFIGPFIFVLAFLDIKFWHIGQLNEPESELNNRVIIQRLSIEIIFLATVIGLINLGRILFLSMLK